MNAAGLDLAILAPALVTGLLVLSTHVPLGQQVLARSIVFIDLAIAQLAGLGVIVADYLGAPAHDWAVQIAAAGAAAAGAGLLTWSERRWPQVQEALIGALFVLAASCALLLLSNNPHGGEHLKELLAGQILWVSWTELYRVALFYALLLALWFGLGKQHLGRWGFYLLFAMSVTASVQLVGVYLVFASLILPALATKACKETWSLPLGYGAGVAGYVLGLVASALFDLPAGPSVVCALAIAAAVGAWVSSGQKRHITP